MKSKSRERSLLFFSIDRLIDRSDGSGSMIGFGTDRKRLEKQWDYGSRVLEEFLGVSSRPGERSYLSLSRVFASASVSVSVSLSSSQC